MKHLDKIISLYENVYDKQGSTIQLREFLLSDQYKREVEQIRSISDKSIRNELKRKLPLITVSGVFSPTRSTPNLVSHSGLICIDIDESENKHIRNFSSLKNQIANLKEVLYCAKSVSGKGYFCIIPILYPSYHREHFEALEKDWASYGIVIDRSCKDITRMRGYSFDDDPYVNEDALVYKAIELPQRNQYTYFENTSDSDIIEVAEELYRRGINITESYEDWFVVSRVLAIELGEIGRPVFHRLSSLSSKYNPKECDRCFDTCKRASFSPVGTFFWKARLYGVSIFK